LESFIKKKYINETLTPDKEIQLEQDLDETLNKQNILTRLVKKYLNPLELNVRLRKEFKLDEDFKLIYLLQHERMQLGINSISIMCIPLLFSCIVILLLGEMTGYSKLNESFENSYLFLTGMLFYVGVVILITIQNQRSAIMRIYFNETTNKYVSIRMKGFFKFRKEEFQSENCLYRYDPALAKNKNAFVELMTKQYGNIYVNGKLQRVDFKSFSSYASIEKLFGQRIVGILKGGKFL
jgi:hypothetical protein